MSRALIVLLILLSLPTGVRAQEPREILARADALAARWRAAVRGERLEHWWISSSELVFRRWSGPDTFDDLHIDAKTGAVTPAFDEKELRRQLGLEESFALRALGYVAAKSGWAFCVADRTFVVDRATRALSTAPDDATMEWEAPKSAGRTSRNGDGAMFVEFVNRLDHAIDLVWLDAEGAERRYGSIEAGKSRRQHTIVGHLWSVRTGERELGRYRASPERWRIIVDDNTEGRPATVDIPPKDRASPADAPGGGLRAFVRDHDLWIRDLSSGEERVLDADGTEDDRYVERFHWSPDGNHLAVVREVPAERHTVHLIESSPKDQQQPKLRSFDYLKPGDRIAKPRIVLFDVQTGERTDVSTEKFANPWSLDRFRWTRDGAELRFLYEERGHQLRRILGVSSTGGVRVLLEETAATFVDYSQKTFLEWLPDDSAFLWMTERSGWNHIEVVDAKSGTRKPVTQGEWVVRAVDDVDFEAGTIRIRAMGAKAEQDPYHVHHARVRLDDGALTWLTDGDGTHALSSSPTGEWWIDTWSRVDLPPVHELRRNSDGTLVGELARADVSELRGLGWTPPERFAAPGRDGSTPIWGVLLRPSTFDPGKRYPVVEQIYAGPHGHHVPKSFSAWLGAQGTAELGFIVGQIDGMGTNWRSKHFHDVCWQNLGDAGFPDRIAWWRAAAHARPSLDLERVGIYGGSAGGQNAMRALIAHSDFYDVAVADCGCHDNRMDKIWWNEAWMGWPIGPHYAASSNVDQAHRLAGKLLLIVGELDRNVDPSSTLQVVDALIRADKDFDFLLVPNVGHGAAGHPYAQRRQAEFLVEHLGGPRQR